MRAGENRRDVNAVAIVELLADILSRKHNWKTYLAIELIAELEKRLTQHTKIRSHNE